MLNFLIYNSIKCHGTGRNAFINQTWFNVADLSYMFLIPSNPLAIILYVYVVSFLFKITKVTRSVYLNYIKIPMMTATVLTFESTFEL